MASGAVTPIGPGSHTEYRHRTSCSRRCRAANVSQRKQKGNLIRRCTLNRVHQVVPRCQMGAPCERSIRAVVGSVGDLTRGRLQVFSTDMWFSLFSLISFGRASESSQGLLRDSLFGLSWGETSHAIPCSVANESRHRVRDHQLRLVLSDFSPQSHSNPQTRQDPRRSNSLSGFKLPVVMGPGGVWSFLPATVLRGGRETRRENWV